MCTLWPERWTKREIVITVLGEQGGCKVEEGGGTTKSIPSL